MPDPLHHLGLPAAKALAGVTLLCLNLSHSAFAQSSNADEAKQLAAWRRTSACVAVMKREIVVLADKHRTGDTKAQAEMVRQAEWSFALIGTAYKQGLRKAQADKLLEEAEAALQRDIAAREVARSNLARVKPLAKLNALSQKDLDDAQGRFDEALAAYTALATGTPTEVYPLNPNGSPEGLTGVTTPDGRFTAMMPHPERVFRNIQMSWTSGDKNALSPWMQIWRNARRWVG